MISRIEKQPSQLLTGVITTLGEGKLSKIQSSILMNDDFIRVNVFIQETIRLENTWQKGTYIHDLIDKLCTEEIDCR